MDKMTAMRHQAENGLYMGGSILGYDYVKDRLIPNSFERKIIQFIFYAYLSGRRKSEIAEFLQKHKFTGKKGGVLYLNAISNILANRTYIGEVKFEGKFHKGIHEPVISNEVFHAVQKLEKMSVTIGDDLWLSNALFCPRCGSAMVKSQNYYVCSRSRFSKKCKANGIKKEKAEQWVLNHLCELVPKVELIDDSFVFLLLSEQKNKKKNMEEVLIKERRKLTSLALNWLTRLLLPPITVFGDLPSKRMVYLKEKINITSENLHTAKMILSHQLPIEFKEKPLY